MRNGSLRFGPALRAATLAALAATAASCNEIDTTRKAPPAATLGDDLYGLMCDRVGASSLTEDLTGGSYEKVCHYDGTGAYADKVDLTGLPPVTGEPATTTRRLGVAKVEAMGRHRTDLIHAFNAMFPDVTIDDPAAPGTKIRLHTALVDLAAEITPLYETNPWDAAGAPLLPQQTRALARLFDALSTSKPARDALSRIWGRQGYRPFQVGLGAVRAALSYPELRKLTVASLNVLGPNGVAVPQLQQLLTITKNELSTSVPIVEPLPNYVVDRHTAQPNRSRSTVEVAAALLLTEHPSFAAPGGAAGSSFIALRDHRGFVVPMGNEPGLAGTVPAPFTDVNGDGFADVDAFGRFVDTAGQPIGVASPFAIPGLTTGTSDPFGRPAQQVYRYVDTSRAMSGALTRTLLPLLDASRTGAAGDPAAWETEHESMMYALSGAYALYGRREPAAFDYDSNTVMPGAASCPRCVPYQRFRGEESPIPMLAHAAGQVLADPDSDAILLGMTDLVRNHTQEVARLLGAALQIRALSLAHDAAAKAGKEPAAGLRYDNPIWEKMSAIVARILTHPGLTQKLLAAIADPGIVSPQGTSKHMGETLANLMANKDQLTYDQTNINGDAVNLTVGLPSTADPQTPVDRKQPKQGDNRSCFQRSLQTIHDANGVKTCNKQGATVPSILGGLHVTYPLFGGTLDECTLFEFDNLAAFYLDSLLDPAHPKRSKLVIKDGTLNGIISFLGGFGVSADDMFQTSSAITGLTLHPGPVALNRLVFFGADSDLYPGMPDHDALNDDPSSPIPTNNFVHSVIEPVSAIPCGPDAQGVATCATFDDTLRVRDANTIFLWERNGFYNYLQPMVTTLANLACAPDLSSCDNTNNDGEQILIDLIDLLGQHWPGKDHGAECTPGGDATSNPKYCSEAGINNYEPLLVEALQGDIVPALNAFAVAATQLSTITVQRGPSAGQTWTGAQVLEKVTQILFDPVYAQSVGMVDRKGSPTTLSVDGKTQLPVTGYNLFADALHSIDTTFDGSACSCVGLTGQGATDCQANQGRCQADINVRKGQWKRARSHLVDAFLKVDGTGASAAFANPSTPHMLTALLAVTREQLNAHCPDRETGGKCAWAKKELGDKLESVFSGPLFAGIMDVQEAVRVDEPSRRQMESLLTYVLQSSDHDALQATLASMTDLVQILADDNNFAPIFNGVANAAAPDADGANAGVADLAIKALKALSGDQYDRHHALDYVLPAIVTPVGGTSLTPIEILMDTIAEVNRIDASRTDALDTDDYQAIMGTARDFLTSNTRGLEQFYFIVQHRPHE